MQSNSDRPESARSSFDVQWQDTLDLLRLMQSDYQGARAELDRVSQTLADREDLLNERMRYALLQSSGCRPMCLVGTAVNGPVSSILGGIVLGEIAEPRSLPRSPRLEVRCLGSFEVSCGGRSIIRWHSAKSRAVLEYLLLKPGRPVGREILMEALWPGCDPRAAGNNLKVAVHELRQTLDGILGDGEAAKIVIFNRGAYQLSRDVEMWVDVDEFEQRWTNGRRFERDGKPADAVREFELAAALYRSDYIQDEPYEEWAMLRRDALCDTYLSIVGRLADYAMASGDYEAAIGHCQKIISRDACREDVYRCLMRCHSRLGRRNRALRWYETCRRTVRAELGAEPEKETQTLFQKLLANDPV